MKQTEQTKSRKKSDLTWSQLCHSYEISSMVLLSKHLWRAFIIQKDFSCLVSIQQIEKRAFFQSFWAHTAMGPFSWIDIGLTSNKSQQWDLGLLQNISISDRKSGGKFFSPTSTTTRANSNGSAQANEEFLISQKWTENKRLPKRYRHTHTHSPTDSHSHGIIDRKRDQHG